jgi:hypothetical protein
MARPAGCLITYLPQGIDRMFSQGRACGNHMFMRFHTKVALRVQGIIAPRTTGRRTPRASGAFDRT